MLKTIIWHLSFNQQSFIFRNDHLKKMFSTSEGRDLHASFTETRNKNGASSSIDQTWSCQKNKSASATKKQNIENKEDFAYHLEHFDSVDQLQDDAKPNFRRMVHSASLSIPAISTVSAQALR